MENNNKLSIDVLLSPYQHVKDIDVWMAEWRLQGLTNRYESKVIACLTLGEWVDYSGAVLFEFTDGERTCNNSLLDCLTSLESCYPAAEGDTFTEAINNLNAKLGRYSISQFAEYAELTSALQAVLYSPAEYQFKGPGASALLETDLAKMNAILIAAKGK